MKPLFLYTPNSFELGVLIYIRAMNSANSKRKMIMIKIDIIRETAEKVVENKTDISN